MSTYLLDTDTCIYWLKGIQAVRDRLVIVGLRQVSVSVISVAELYFGAYNSAKVAENMTRLEQFAQSVQILPLGVPVLKTFGQLKASLRQQGHPLADFDLLIASTALAENRVLVTNNTRHYDRIPGIRLENWV